MRYKHVTSGVIVNVRDDKVLGSEWEAQPKPKPEPKKAPSKSEK